MLNFFSNALFQKASFILDVLVLVVYVMLKFKLQYKIMAFVYIADF